MNAGGAIVLLVLLCVVIGVLWLGSAMRNRPEPQPKRKRPTVQQVIEAAGGEVISMQVDHDSEVFAAEVTYKDQYGVEQTRYAIQHKNYRPNVGNGGYYWNKPIRSSIIEADKSAEQIIMERDAEVQRLRQQLAELEQDKPSPTG